MSGAVTKFKPSFESPVDMARRLEAQARNVAHEASNELLTDLSIIAARCSDISSLESLPAGVRDVLRRLGETISADLEKVQAITVRSA